MQNIYPLCGIEHVIDSHLNNHGNQILIFRTLSDTLHNKS